jgi:hypothetical protein
MQTNEPLNTFPIQSFIQQVKAADNGKQREVRMDINTAKNLAFTLGIVMSRLQGDMEKFVKENANTGSNEPVDVTMDGGSNWG